MGFTDPLSGTLKDVKQSWNLHGVVLVGSFPEAMLVRRWIWNRKTNVTIAGTDYHGDNQKNFLRIVPEIVAERADIVLADLDGKWEDIYEKGPMDLQSVEALPAEGTSANWPVDNMVFTSTKFNYNTLPFQDFFWIKDDNFTRLASQAGTLKLRLHTSQIHPELSDANRSQNNPIALPDILVSRINANNIGVVPDPNFRDVHGKGFLDPTGKPQPVFTNSHQLITMNRFTKDPAIERELLINYFDRNHSYRIGGNPVESHRVASVNYELSDLSGYLKKASSSFQASVLFNNASLLDYVEFLKTPATLKGISAHSGSITSGFGDSYNALKLERAVGSNPWRWIETKNGSNFCYTPSLSQQQGTADFHLHRTIYENNILSETGGNLFIHNGCQVNSPISAKDVPYNHELYGRFQNAESILFFLNGIALASRAKVFYDTPEGFTKELGKHSKKKFGEGWKAYFDNESKKSGLAKQAASNKKTYTWSILGDWTVRVKYDSGLGLLRANTDLESYAIHANQTWIQGWNFDARLNKIEGVGDFNGDGIDDIVISSSWGIGVLTRQNEQWKTLLVKPKNTWFGQWRYNSSTNQGKDKIEAIADFNGDGKDEILISSSWGIGMLKLSGNTFTSVFAKRNGTRFGTWTYNTPTVRDNKIEGVGDFNGDGKADVLISKPYGIGVLTLSGNTFNSIVVKPAGTRFGRWTYNTPTVRDNKIEAIADFNGDGKDDILVTKPYGIGVLTLAGNTFNSIVVKPAGTSFGRWTYNTNTVRDNIIEGTGDFNGDGKDDILVSKPYGIGVLTLAGDTFNSILVQPVGTSFGGWTYNTPSVYDNKIEKIADFNGDGNKDILISKPYGIALLTLSGNTFDSLHIKPNGSRIGDWNLRRSNSFPVVGSFDGIAGKDILVYKE